MPPELSLPFEYQPRSYLHFDAPLGRERAERLATDAVAVSRHPFLPFILVETITQKIQKRLGGGVEPKAPKVRPIAYAAHGDSHIFSHYSGLYEHRYEEVLRERGLDRVVTAFRSLKGRCNIDFANEAFEFIRRQGPCFVLASDITDFFNQLQHRQLKGALRQLLGVEELPADHYAVFKAVTKYCMVDRKDVFQALGIHPHHPRRNGRYRLCTAREFRERIRGNGLCRPNVAGRGIPQGSPISAMLANLYMLDFDSVVNTFVTAHGGLYRRYCDGLLVVLPTDDSRTEVLTLLQRHLQDLGLEARPDKTELIDFVQENGRLTTPRPLNYLGFTFDGRHKRIRPASVARYYRKMRLGVGRAKAIRYRVNTRNGAQPWTPLRRRKLHLLYSYLGRHNFTGYAFRAARIMNDPGIKKQIQPHWRKLQTLISGG